MKVDADYTAKPYEEWKASDWPRNHIRTQIMVISSQLELRFGPPHLISKL